MKIEQFQLNQAGQWTPATRGTMEAEAQLVLVFGGTSLVKDETIIRRIRERYPSALINGCSTAGEIRDTQVTDDSLIVTAVRFEHTRVDGAYIEMQRIEDSYQAGRRLAQMLDHHELAHVFVLSDGLLINGSDLVRGLTEGLPATVTVTGGLSGDGPRFQETWVIHGDRAERHLVSALGFYGERLKIGFGSLGGWDPFGPERVITRSKGNILYEMEGKSALELYKRYLGDQAKGLPAAGLRFPLSIRTGEPGSGVVRTILSIDERDQSMTFAGDVPEGAYARLMKANYDRLIDGAMGAAKTSLSGFGEASPQLAVLISCVGRKMVLGQRVEEEVEGVREIIGAQATITGFYSYGEISPFSPEARCELHNQTMTITVFRE